MKFIIHNNQETIIFNTKAKTYKIFLKELIQHFGHNLSDKFTMKYKDEEDELILLQNEEDFMLAMEWVQEESMESLDIFISNLGNPVYPIDLIEPVEEQKVEHFEESKYKEIPSLPS